MLKINLSASEFKYKATAFILILLAWSLRGWGLSDRFPLNMDESFTISRIMDIRRFFFEGNVNSFLGGFVDFYSRPTNYLLSIIPTIIGGKEGMFFGHVIYGLISLIILYFLALKIFDDHYAALGTLVLGVFSGVHINYSMRVTYITAFVMAAASLYFFIESNYGEKRTRSKIICGLFMGMSFTAHYSVGPLPFIYIFTEFYIYFTQAVHKKTWKRNFAILLISMSFPIIFWEVICLIITFFGNITTPYFKDYILTMTSHSNLRIPEPVSNIYFLSIPFHLESSFFPILVITGMSGFFIRYLKFNHKQKTFLFMLSSAIIFYMLFPLLACMSRLIFPLYIFFIPVGGFGFAIIYREFRKRGKKQAYFITFAIVGFLAYHGFVASSRTAAQQRIPKRTFEYLKAKKISKIIVGRTYRLFLKPPFLKGEGYTTKMWDDSGYTLTTYHTYKDSSEVIPLAKKNGVKYLLAQFVDYGLGPQGSPHRFMYLLHDKGLKRPVYSWGPREDFPLSLFDKEPFKLEAYNRLYSKRKLPISAKKIICSTMLYDISSIVR